MSYTYLLEQGEESSAASFSDIPPFVLSRLNLTAEKSCSKGSGTASCQSSQSGMMSPHLMELRGKERSMSSAEDSLARTFQVRGGGLGLKANEADSGQKWPESLAKYDQDSRSWRTAQCLLFEDLGESLETFPNWGMMQGGECWELAMSAHLIEGSESGLLPTPLKSDSAARRPSKNWQGNDLPSAVWRICGGEGNPQKPPTKLHPEFVEWMMAWPIGWTGLRQSEMDKFQSWQHSHSKFLEGSSND